MCSHGSERRECKEVSFCHSPAILYVHKYKIIKAVHFVVLLVLYFDQVPQIPKENWDNCICCWTLCLQTHWCI